MVVGLVIIAAGIALGGWYFYQKFHATPAGFKLEWLDLALAAIAFLVVIFGSLMVAPTEQPTNLRAFGEFIAKPITAWRRPGGPPTPPPPSNPA